MRLVIFKNRFRMTWPSFQRSSQRCPSYSIYRSLSCSNNQENGMLAIPCCIMTMLPHSHCPLCATITGQEQHGCGPPHPVISRYGSQWFIFVSDTKIETQREEIIWHFGNSTETNWHKRLNGSFTVVTVTLRIGITVLEVSITVTARIKINDNTVYHIWKDAVFSQYWLSTVSACLQNPSQFSFVISATASFDTCSNLRRLRSPVMLFSLYFAHASSMGFKMHIYGGSQTTVWPYFSKMQTIL
jgi:hypothetical protein